MATEYKLKNKILFIILGILIGILPIYFNYGKIGTIVSTILATLVLQNSSYLAKILSIRIQDTVTLTESVYAEVRDKDGNIKH